MAWKSGSAAALRNRNEKERQEKTVMATAAGGAEPLSQRKSADSRNPLALGSTGTSWEKGSAAALRAQKQQEATSRQTGTDLYSTALEDYRTRNNLGFADDMDSRSDELNRQKVTVSPAEKMEQNASTVQKLREQRNNGIRMDVYSTVNNWKDASERNRELARLVTDPTLPRGAVSAADLPAGVDYLAADTGGMGIMPVLENTRYMDSDLKKMGYTQDEINRARLYMKAYNDLSLGERAGRRVESDLEGKKENIKGMIGQYAGALSPALTASAEEQMIRRVQSGRYTDEQLEAAGYDPELIRTAHERIRSGELYDKADDDSNRMKGLYEWGRDAHKAGENLTADAMAGESNVGRFFHGATSSAAENLIVSAINPALVLPVLSAHGAGDSMAASDEAGESPEKAILKATAKFGAGWAINSVGVADLAKTMGSDYAKDTVAGTIADWVRRQVGNQAFREAYPAVANAISGGADNAMQAFVETYADKAIDAVMGDQEAAKTLFNKDTFLTALEAGLSGGASGALGGAVGTGLSRMNAGDSSLRGNVERYAAQDEYEQALKEHQRREELAREPGDGIAEQTVVNDDPAVHTAAQNASIEEYKNSVDPKMAEYVDKVRAGEKLEPYVVTRTSDRMRSAMMELTGLDKVGDYTLLDNNGVQHITNRHAGGDGSADATMKNSADVARAAYVLNNFDNAYLGTRKAEGYFDSRSKRAPIVIFEKKIDGSHIIVEAVTDTKRGKNYIISEYLSSVGVDPKEIAKTLRPPMDAAESDPRHTSKTLNEEISAISASMPQSPMDAVADPRDTSKTLAEDYDATASIAPGEGSVNGNRVKNGVETVESTAETAADGNTPHPSAAQTASHQGEAFSSYADVENRVDAAQLNTADWNRGEQRAAARQLVNRAQMTTKAAQAVVDAMPQGVGAAVYAQAANSLYRMGVTQDVKSFEQAVNLTGGMNSLGGAVRQVLALGKTGENALRIAYTYGQGEAEAYNARKTSEIGSGQGAVNPDAGTYFKGRNVSKGTNAMDAFIELGAKSSGTAIHRAVEGLQNNARGFIKAAAGEMYLSGEAGSETVMHETFHMLNEWSPETGQAVMDRLLTYLVQQNGMESTEKLVESYLGRYEDSGVKMTWNQALEEITADAMETVFGTADGFRNFVRQQAAEAKMNAKARGMIGKVMDKIDSLLHTVLADVNRFLKNEPTNAAAKAARSLTEQQLKDLQNLYFEHQAEAGSKYREVLTSQAQSASSPNRGAKEQGSAEVKYSIDPSYAQDIDEWNRDGRNSREIFVLGSTAEALQGLGARENDIYMKGDKISLILEQHPEMTLNEIKRIPEILDDPILVLSSRNKGRAGSQNTRLVLFGSVKAQDGRPVLCVLDLQPVENRIVIQDMQKATSAYTKDNDPVRFVRNSEVLYTSENKKRTTALLRTLGFQMPSELQRYGSMGSISYHGQNVKMEGVPFTGIETQTKYQLDVDSDAAEATRTAALGDVDKQTDLMRQVSELGGKVRLSDQSITDIVRAVLSDTGSKLDAKTFTERMRALSDYIALNKDVSWDDVYTFASDIAEQLMQRSSHKNDEMWKHYPELHQMSMVIEKGSKDYSEILYHWGSWANARKELARRGVKITQSKEGVHSHWDADFTELQKLGAGLFPTETPNSAVEALEAMAEAHDTIRPVMQNDYSEDWDGAKQDIAMQIMLRYMNSTEVANEQNAEARQEFTKQWEEMRKQAKQEALEARAKVELERAKREQELKEAAESAADPFRLEAAKANARADKAEAFARKQRESVSTTIRLAKDRAEKQLQKARDAREMDTTRRNINKMTSQLTQMLEKPSEKGYVPEYLLEKVRPVAALANDAVGNRKAAAQLRAELNGTYGPVPEGGNIREAVEGLSRGIDREVKLGDRAAMEWQQSRLPEQISDWLNDVNEAREIEMEKLRGEIENAEKWLKKDTPEKKAYIARLNADLKAYQDGNLATLTADQTRELSEILEKTLFIVKNENVMLGSIEDVMVDDFAEGVSGELKSVRQQRKDTRFGKIFREVTSVYKLNTMNIERNFERLGGYNHGGCMEQLGRQLNEGQARKERIKAEGERIFSNVTGPEHAEELYHFTHDLVDIGLKTRDGKPWLVTHDVMTELWVQLQNRQGMHHLLYGGATIADMSFSTKGLAGLGEQYSETVTLGELVTTDKDGSKLNAYEISKREDTLRTSILGEIEKNLTAYDDLWISDFRELGKLTKGYINEASMTLYGVKRARVENYIHMNVDRNTLVEQNEGVRRDVSVGSEGYMKTRQNSSKPLALVGLVKQASESIENAAQFAGMAIPLRNAEKVLNSMQGGETQYGAIERSWGRAGRKYIQKAMADLSGSKGDSEVFDHLSSVLRGNAAAAVLTGNLNVTLLQAASLPTAAAELGWGGTGASAVQFVMNLKPSQLNSIVERAYRFGDSLLPTRLRGSSRGELSSAAKEQGVFSTAHDVARNSQNAVLRYGTRAVDALADFAGGSIGWMDKVTVASLFHGAENYVQKNLAEYDLTKADLPTKTMEDGSKAYQEAVMSKFRRVVERTQPNYTVMQRTGMQRSKNQMLKTLSMFSTQRQQNAQIMVSAVEDLAAQWQRNDQAKAALEKAKAENDTPRLAECKAAAEKAKADRAEALKRFWDAASSQIVQTAVIAGLGILVKFILHRWDDLQDENGDMTLASLGGSFLYQFSNSMVSNYTGGSELWTAGESIHSKRVFGNYDSVSMTGFSAINDAVTSMTKLNALLDKDTGEMTEKELDDYADSVKWAWADTAGQLMMLVGVPYNNGKKYVQAVFAWMDTAKQWDETGEKNFNSTPDSATGQYDRLFEAIQTGNTEEVQAATKKLERMLAEGKIKELKTDDQLKARLKKYDEDILDAARAKNAGDLEARVDAKQEVYDRLCTAYGVKKLGEKGETDEDKAQRARFRELIDKAVNEKAEQLYKGGTEGSVYDDLTEAVDTGRTSDVQDEIRRLRTAGKADSQIKSEITDAVKEEYLAGNDHDREKLEKLLTSLTKEDGTAMYEEKNFAQWVKDAAKKEEQAKNSKDEWAGVR
ncbi:MAG: hypothetical protein U0N75_04155 [Faecalibacterium sp.]